MLSTCVIPAGSVMTSKMVDTAEMIGDDVSRLLFWDLELYVNRSSIVNDSQTDEMLYS